MHELTARALAQRQRPYLPTAAKCRQTLLHAKPIQRQDIPRKIAEAVFATGHRSSSRQNPLAAPPPSRRAHPWQFRGVGFHETVASGPLSEWLVRLLLPVHLRLPAWTIHA